MSRFMHGSLLLAGLLVVGCANKAPLVAECKMPWHGGDRSTMPALVGVQYGERATPIPMNSVQFTDWSTAHTLALQRLSAARTATNTVEVAARFVSCSNSPQTVRVRTSFMDANQAATEPPSAWRTVYLQPHLTANYSEFSTSTSVKNYLVEIAP